MEPRPTFDSPAVIAYTIDAMVPLLVEWTEINDVSASAAWLRSTYGKALRAELAVVEDGKVDGYALADWFEAPNFPVDAELVSILHDTSALLRLARRNATHDWVMRTGMRFPAKEGQHFKFTRNGRNRVAQCIGVVSTEARGFGLVNKVTFDVDAEDIVEVVR